MLGWAGAFLCVPIREHLVARGWTTALVDTRVCVVSQLDRELAEALEAPEPVAVPNPPAATKQPARRSVGLVVVLLALGGGLLVLAITSIRSSAVYSKGVDELVSESDRLTGRNVRVEGTLVKGTLQRRAEPCEYRFEMERNGASVQVHYPQCSVPDTFRDMPYTDVKVTAEGRLRDDGQFEASQIMAKCPSKYEGNDSAMGGPGMPPGPAVGAERPN